MRTENTKLSLGLLLLNDLLLSKAIDQDIYDKAAEQILSMKAPTYRQSEISRAS